VGLFERMKSVVTPRSEVTSEPSSASINQLLDYISSTGDTGLLDLYGVSTGTGAMRDKAVTFSVFFRIVNLLSSVMAQLMTSGSLRVIDPNGSIDKSRSTRTLLELLQHSPDDVTPAYQFIEDLACDYLIDGNALLHCSKMGNKTLGLYRLEPNGAGIDFNMEGDGTYRAHRAYDTTMQDYEEFPESEIVHMRWPLLSSTSRYSSYRSRFASPPVILMRPSLRIGLESDKYILDWYKTDSPKANVGISLRKDLKPEQIKQFRSIFVETAKSRAPLIMGQDAKFTNLANTSSSNDQSGQREFQVGEICRAYGVPGPLVNQNVTQWGSGIEQLSKLFYRFGLRQHCERLLGPMKMRLLKPGYQFSLDEIDILRGDTTGIAAMLTALRGDAQTPEVATIQERRRIAGLPVEPEYGELQPLPQRYSGESDPMNEDDNMTEDDDDENMT